MNKVTIIMYHYVRDLPFTRYPRIKGLLTSEFKNQLEYISNHYEIVTVEQCLEAIVEDTGDFPNNAALLTFDDGYSEHFTEVFPLLDKQGIQGAFFPPSQAILEHKVLDVNKIHFILASTKDPNKLLDNIHQRITELANEFNLNKPDYYVQKLSDEKHRYDSWKIVYIKRLLQRELPEEARSVILDELFAEYVGVDEETFAKELYMSPEQIRCMHRHGMFIGGHGYAHTWLNTLEEQDQRDEVIKTKEFLRYLAIPDHKLIMCYPYGAFDESLISIMQEHGFKAGLTTQVTTAELSLENRFTLGRFDTNDFPKN